MQKNSSLPGASEQISDQFQGFFARKNAADAHGISAGRSTFTLLEETLVGTDGGIGQLGRVGAVRKAAVSLADVHMVKQIGAHKMGIALVMIPGQTNCQQYLATAARIMAAHS